MPGMIEHLYFCSEIYNNIRERPGTRAFKNGGLSVKPQKYAKSQKLIWADFMLSGILPDLSRDHNLAHFKARSEIVPELYVPTLSAAERWLPRRIGWSVGRGTYAHLYLDYHFWSDFLMPRFYWDFKDGEEHIERLDTGEAFTVDEFFSPAGLYSAYAELNDAIIGHGLLDVETIRGLPDKLPKTYLDVIDSVGEQPWREQFEEYLTHRSTTPNRLFPVEDYLEFSSKLARRYAAEMLQDE